MTRLFSFNSQPREGGWIDISASLSDKRYVSTRSHAKAAGVFSLKRLPSLNCFNSQPREGGWDRRRAYERHQIGFNSQPREGGWIKLKIDRSPTDGFNSQPREGGWFY